MNYRIYINGTGWEYYATVITIEEVISVLDYVINNLKIEYFIVIEHNILEDSDNPIIRTVKQYERIKEELKHVSRRTKKLYK